MGPTVHPRERVYFAICVAVSILVYLAFVVSVIGIGYLITFAVVGFIAQGFMVGSLKGNSVRVSDEQFPEVYRLAADLAARMGLSRTPDVYLLQSGGLINAFATRFVRRNFVVLYSEVVELAYEQGQDALAFVIAHELAHIKRGHLFWRMFISPGMFVPFLGTAYSRSCEYTCDRFAAFYNPEGALKGLLVLATGKRLYGRASVQSLCEQAEREYDSWIWLAEIFQTHPNLPRRVAALRNLETGPVLLPGLQGT